MDARILRDFDSLEHSKEKGFYDAELDMFFRDAGEWLRFKYNKSFSEIL